LSIFDSRFWIADFRLRRLASIRTGDTVRGLHMDMTTPAKPARKVYLNGLELSRDNVSGGISFRGCRGEFTSPFDVTASSPRHGARPDKIGTGYAASTSNSDTSICLRLVQSEFSAVSPFGSQPGRGGNAAPRARCAGLFLRDIK
jgi:hypothetical protein